MLVAGSVDALITRRRELEAAHPHLTRFDETTLPPRTFKAGSEAERAWVRACFAILCDFGKADFASAARSRGN